MHLPSNKINARKKIVVSRALPVPGEILVQPGQVVNALTVVARAEMPHRLKVIDVASALNLPQVDMDEIAQVEIGDWVEPHTIVASGKVRGALFPKKVKAGVAGEVIGLGPGWILLETERTLVEVQAFISGVVSRIISNRVVVIESTGAIIEAACGFGGEAFGRLKRVVNSPFEAIEERAFDESVAESVIVGGRTIDEAGLRKADEWQVRAIIVGSISADLMRLDPPVNVRVIATEGFGEAPMAAYTFGLLTSLSRKEVSVRGQTPATVKNVKDPQANEPSIILAPDPPTARGNYAGIPALPPEEKPTVKPGSKVRVVQGEQFGSSGVIDLIPPDPQLTESGILLPGAFVKISNDVHFVPWANMRLID
jgi:hypothetical protein